MGWRDILASVAPRKQWKYGKEPRGESRDFSGLSDISDVVGTSKRGDVQRGAADDVANSQAEARRERLLALLTERPGLRYAVTVNNPDADSVILALAIRGAGEEGSAVTCEVHILRKKYDPFLLIDLIERHGGTVH